jgi:c-di-GMP-binding flagellar brake protein YcgR
MNRKHGMSEPNLAHSSNYPRIDWAISIALIKSITERVATVTQSTSNETWVELSRPTLPPVFKEGERVRIKHWDKGSIYYWVGEVRKVIGPESQNMAISIDGEGVTLGRRKSFRLRTEIPFSFIVTQAAQKGIVSQEPCDSMIRNISEGGIAFDTNLSLKVGDELKVDVCLPGPTQMSTEGWIVRSEEVKPDGKCLYSVALEFLELKPEQREQIQQCMSASTLVSRQV